MSGKLGDKVGYVVMVQRGRYWAQTDAGMQDHISQAVAQLRTYQQDEPQSTFAVARADLVMISRPD